MKKSSTGISESSPSFQGGVAEGRGGYSSSADTQTKKFPTGDDKLKNRDYLKPRRKTLRSNLTPAKAVLWTAIRNNKLAGRKFRRLQISDSKRAAYLQGLGIRVLRFENKLIFDDLEWVLSVIENNFEVNDP